MLCALTARLLKAVIHDNVARVCHAIKHFVQRVVAVVSRLWGLVNLVHSTVAVFTPVDPVLHVPQQ